MQFSIICYDDEINMQYLSWEEERELFRRIRSTATGSTKFGPFLQMLPSTTAMTVRLGREQQIVVYDGPSNPTREQLRGIILLECESLEFALGIAEDLAHANLGSIFEIRPVSELIE